jgi:hypothetical protein
MNGLVIALSIAVLLTGFVGSAIGQGYYGAYQPGQAQSYDPQSAYGQYGQAQPSYGQYGAMQQYYGQQYGQGSASPQQYNYGGQQYPQTGYQNYGGYGDYSGVPYGQQPSYSYGNVTPSPGVQRSRPTPGRARAASTQNQSAPPSPTYSSANTQSSAVISEPDELIRSEIYWDGRESRPEEGSAVQAAPPTALPRAASPMAPAVRQERRSQGESTAIQTPKRTRRNVVRQARETTPPAPERRNVKWGKETKSEDRPGMRWGMQDAPASDAKPQMKWGKQDKPAAIGVEPGSFQGSTLQGSGSQAQVQPQASDKRFQWGRRE